MFDSVAFVQSNNIVDYPYSFRQKKCFSFASHASFRWRQTVSVAVEGHRSLVTSKRIVIKIILSTISQVLFDYGSIFVF